MFKLLGGMYVGIGSGKNQSFRKDKSVNFCASNVFNKEMSDSSYAAVTRHRRPYSTSGRPPELERIDDAWAAESLSDDEIDVHRHELAIAPLLDDNDLDIDAVVISNGQMGPAFTSAFERRRRDGTKWTDLAMDIYQMDLKGKKDNLQQPPSNSIHGTEGATSTTAQPVGTSSTTESHSPGSSTATEVINLDRSTSETSISAVMRR